MKCLSDNEITNEMGSVNLSTLICDQRDYIAIEIWSVTDWRLQCLVGFGLVYLFILSVTYVSLDTSITDYNLQHNL